MRALDSMAAAGAKSATVVIGYRGAEVAEEAKNGPIPVAIRDNPDWETAPNGVSLLVAAPDIVPGTMLAMCDHLISPTLLTRLRDGASGETALGIDRRLGDPWVDEADVTRVRTKGRKIKGIGKNLLIYDAYDTGAFLIGPKLIGALRTLPSPSLSAGVAALGNVEAVDIGDARWLDVDDPRAFEIAERSWTY